MSETTEALIVQAPRFLVLFEREDSVPGRSPMQTLAATMGFQRPLGIDPTQRTLRIPARGPTRAQQRYFSDLRIAAVNISEEERSALERAPGVAMVVENERRSIPPLMAAAPGSSPPPSQHSWCLSSLGIGLTYPADGTGIKVAVLDTGLDLEHPDFAHHFGRANFTARSFIDGETVQDGHGHGTHCCGIVAGAAPSATGVRYSVAPAAELMVGKVLSDEGFGYDDGILAGIQWAAENGARVISMSLGSERAPNAAHNPLYERVASVLLDQGVLIVAAAGNESDRPRARSPVGNPAACPSILAVGAVDAWNDVAPFSCAMLDPVGQLDVCAPGVGVFSAWTQSGYNTISGTSMACPHVAGLACLRLQMNPGATARDIWGLLTRTPGVLPLPVGAPNAEDFGFGLVQA